MKVVILAGGVGSRLIEETKFHPKALVKIGRYPILWHIMMYYATYGFNEFIIALGYKGQYIKRWMQEYASLKRNITINTGTGEVIVHKDPGDNRTDWIVHLVDTGEKTFSGGRIKRLIPWLEDETFLLTWCDGLSDINLNALVEFHRSHNRLATLTAVNIPPRFGHLILDGNRVVQFQEKPKLIDVWINGAFFVLENEVLEYIKSDDTMFERTPLERLANDGQLMAFRHVGFWQCMDTIHEKQLLEKLWQSGKAPWKIW